MLDKIVDVHSIMPATGWVFDEDSSPVVCLALVTVYQEQFGLTAKMIIALNEFEIGLDLLGNEILSRMTAIRQM